MLSRETLSFASVFALVLLTLAMIHAYLGCYEVASSLFTTTLAVIITMFVIDRGLRESFGYVLRVGIGYPFLSAIIALIVLWITSNGVSAWVTFWGTLMTLLIAQTVVDMKTMKLPALGYIPIIAFCAVLMVPAIGLDVVEKLGRMVVPELFQMSPVRLSEPQVRAIVGSLSFVTAMFCFFAPGVFTAIFWAMPFKKEVKQRLTALVILVFFMLVSTMTLSAGAVAMMSGSDVFARVFGAYLNGLIMLLPLGTVIISIYERNIGSVFQQTFGAGGTLVEAIGPVFASFLAITIEIFIMFLTTAVMRLLGSVVAGFAKGE